MMNWEKLVNASRLGNRPAKVEKGRSPFNSDHDKIIFSGAFRRLAKKTQVHPLATNDHVHNRLTHSLEVACVGRSLGIRVGEKLQAANKLPAGVTAADIGDIIQSTCLAHDIGNPPFGHTGEAAIRSWFQKEGARFLEKLDPEEASDLKTFEGNAQGFRVITSSEYHPYDGGMRMTYATLASFIKYPWTSLPAASGKRPKSGKYGIYKSELSIFKEVADAVGLIRKKGDDWYCRHPFVALMEAADDFCYGILDLEDGLEMGILSWDEVYQILSPVLTQKDLTELEPELSKLRDGRKPPVIRGKVIDAYVEAAANAFLKHEEEFLNGDEIDLISKCDNGVAEAVRAAKDLAKTRIFTHPRKVELEIGSYSVMATLLEVMCNAVLEYSADPKKCSFKSKRVVDLIGPYTFDPRMDNHPDALTPQYIAIMRVIDFISGCTDHYATYLAKQFNGMGEAR
ncbi:MAG: deoxyguanosinetriphosphate triphosphohydrolase [Polynucleobacter sp.]|uniref:deoxyguanosinetriphosphate triphosphohydrolase n=1 Tax=Polynucleobacter sp. TaxID=2029855 RepID=UPI00271E14CD|nr:deoxyguanosinetriphosphate triphosphohydrolase [Polynucleobacter sp.]MDO8713318.1 deoxyguanosinetriphosphate triphosphohydrolase [Polynucleobacter sp.]